MKLRKIATLAFLCCVAGALPFHTAVSAEDRNPFDKAFGGITLGSNKSKATVSTFIGEPNVTSQTGNGLVYGFLFGKNFVVSSGTNVALVFGVEGEFNLSGTEIIETTDPVLGFESITIARGKSFEFRGRLGLLVKNRVLVFAAVGPAWTSYKYFLDDIPIGTFLGKGQSSDMISGLQLGGGIEVAFSGAPVHLRVQFTSTNYKRFFPEDIGLTDADFFSMPGSVWVDHSNKEIKGVLVVTF